VLPRGLAVLQAREELQVPAVLQAREELQVPAVLQARVLP
jgi:hypothetical protein